MKVKLGMEFGPVEPVRECPCFIAGAHPACDLNHSAQTGEADLAILI